MLYKSWNWKWSCFRLVCNFSFDFRKNSCFINKNVLSEIVLKYEVSMSTCPPVHLAYLKIHFIIMKTVNPLSQFYIDCKLQKYVSVNICHCHSSPFMRSLFIAFKKDPWCHFVVRIGSPTEATVCSLKEWLLQCLVINTTSLVQFGKTLSCILSPLAS